MFCRRRNFALVFLLIFFLYLLFFFFGVSMQIAWDCELRLFLFFYLFFTTTFIMFFVYVFVMFHLFRFAAAAAASLYVCMNKWSSNGVVWSECLAEAGWTLPSIATAHQPLPPPTLAWKILNCVFSFVKIYKFINLWKQKKFLIYIYFYVYIICLSISIGLENLNFAFSFVEIFTHESTRKHYLWKEKSYKISCRWNSSFC